MRKLSHRFIFDFNDKIRALPGSTEVREMMVATALEYLDSLSIRARGDADLQWELAKAYEKVGDVQGSTTEPSLGHAADALKSYRKAIDMQEDLARRNLLSPEQQRSVAHAYAQMAAVYRGVNDPKGAVDAASKGPDHARLASGEAAAAAHTHLALAQLLAGDPAAALATNRAAEATLTRLADAEPRGDRLTRTWRRFTVRWAGRRSGWRGLTMRRVITRGRSQFEKHSWRIQLWIL